MGATAFLSSWPGWLLMAVVLRCVWKPIREFINEWRLYKRQQKYPHIVVCRSATPKKERKRLQQHRQVNQTDMVALFKGTMDRCFSTVAQVTIEMLMFLCRQVIDGVSAVVAMFASLIPAKEKEDDSDDVQVQSFSATATSNEPVRKEALPPKQNTFERVIAPELKMNETRESARGSSFPMQRETLQESPMALRGEQIEQEDEIQPIQQEPRRVRKLDPSQRLRRRIPIQTPGRRSNVAQIQTSQLHQPSPRGQVARPRPQPSPIQWQQAASPGSSLQLTVRAEPIDTSALSEQMNKRRVNGEELSLGNPGGKKRRVAYGRTPLQGCAPHPISRARLSKRVRVEREERILESMSRKRVKPNPESAKTETTSTPAAPGLFGTKTPAAAASASATGANATGSTQPTAPIFGNPQSKQPTVATPAAGPFTFGGQGASNSTSTPPADATQTPAKKGETPTPKTDNKTKPVFAPNFAAPFGGAKESTSAATDQQQTQQPFTFGGASAPSTKATAEQSKPQGSMFGNSAISHPTSTAAPAPATATPQPGASQTPNFAGGSSTQTSQNPPPTPAGTPNFHAATSGASASNTAPVFGGAKTATPNGSGPFTTPAPAAAQAPTQNGMAPAPAGPFGSQAADRNGTAHGSQFGSQTQNGSTAAPQAGATNPFGAAPAQPGTTPVFGASAQSAPAPATQFGATNPFGGAPAQQGATPSFGASAQSAPAPAAQFGAPNAFGATPAQQGATSSFGTPAGAMKTPQANGFGEQKENANPFAAPGGSTGFQQAATAPGFGGATTAKTPASNGFGATNNAPAFPAGGAAFSVGSTSSGAKPRRSRPRVAGRGRVGGRR